MQHLNGKLNFILSTVNVDLDWNAYIALLAPKGHFHIVGVIPNPVALPAFPMIAGSKAFGGSPLGSPAIIDMLEFCGRHGIKPVTARYKMSEANEAFEPLEADKARYRIVHENDLA